MLFSTLYTAKVDFGHAVFYLIFKWIHSPTTWNAWPISWYFTIDMLRDKTERAMIAACFLGFRNCLFTSYTDERFVYLLHGLSTIKKVSDRDFSAYLKAEKSRSEEPWSFRCLAWSKKNPRRRGSKALYPQKAKVVAQYIPNAYTLSASMRISMGRRKKISHNVLDYGKLILRNSFFSRDLLQNHLTTG